MTVNIRPEEQIALGRLRALVMADAALQATLGEIEDAGRFLSLTLDIAAGRGLPLAARALQAALRPDPLGLARWTAAPVTGSMRPPPSWLPIHIAAAGGRLSIDWAYFGSSPLTDPFFEESIRRAMARPFNRVFRYRMTLDDFLNPGTDEPGLAPSGFIFHMSRCGSTLVSQMLAALPANLVVSEAAPIDAVLQFIRCRPELPADRQDKALTAIIAAFGRRRGAARHYAVKLDFWHALALPLFRRAFPAVPWVFLYRDPVEVLVSQSRETGLQLMAGAMPPGFYGLDVADTADDYTARVLAKICAAAADGLSQDGGLAVNYSQLPDAVFTTILPHFGIECSTREREIMAQTARRDAKAPAALFAGDSQAKRRDASPRIRALAQRHLAGVYGRLEAASG